MGLSNLSRLHCIHIAARGARALEAALTLYGYGHVIFGKRASRPLSLIETACLVLILLLRHVLVLLLLLMMIIQMVVSDARKHGESVSLLVVLQVR